MAELRFDPTDSVKFDLGRGLVSLDRSYRMLVPADILADLCAAASPEARADFGRRLGTEIGRRVADRLGDAAKTGSLELLLEHLGGDWALVGLGSLGLERWGRALVFKVADSPLGPGADDLLVAVMEGVLQRAMGREVGVVLLGREGGDARFLVTARETIPAVRSWLGAGTSWGEALMKLHARSGSEE